MACKVCRLERGTAIQKLSQVPVVIT
jgi:hypothetical protein